MPTRSILLTTITLAVTFFCLPPTLTAAERPNILWITCEDASPVLRCYGDRQAVTPHIDRLATEGIRYTRAFATASVCTPARSGLITGMYASSLGTQHLRGAGRVPKSVRCFTEYLREAGYYCTNNVKEDYNFRRSPEAWDESSRTAHWRKRPAGKPFFSVFNFTTTHQGQIRLTGKQFAARTARLTPEQRHDPAKMVLPPYYPDDPVIRRDVAKFYDLVTAMDYQVGDLLKMLAEDGLAENTIVFFYSDHGTGMPRHKRWPYDSGLHVPLIVRIPAKYRQLATGDPGTVNKELVSFLDFTPTVLDLAGVDIPDVMQGQPFLGEQPPEPRQYIFAIRDRVDECYEFSRAVRDDRYLYVRHFMPHRPVMQRSTYSEQTPTRSAIRRLAAEGKLSGDNEFLARATKPPEELFDTQADPHQVHNLAASPQHAEALSRMRTAMHDWMLETGDTGLVPEIDLYSPPDGPTPYELMHGNRFPTQRVLETAELIGSGPSARAKQTELLGDEHSAVRYWAAVGLAALGADAVESADALREATHDPHPGVRFAAAEALCQIGRSPDALPCLAIGLESDSRWVRLHAAMSIVAIGRDAKPLLPEIRAAAADKTPGTAALYTRWALGHAIRAMGE